MPLQKLETAANLYLPVVSADVHACSWAICLRLSNVFVSRCIKSTVTLRFSHTTHCRLVLLRSEMWSDLSKIPCATAFGVLYSQTVRSGRNLNGSFLFAERTCQIAGSNVISSPRWFLSAASRVLPGALYRSGWRRCPGRGQLAEQGPGCAAHTQPFLPLLFIALRRFSPVREAALCSMLEIKGDTGRADEKAEGDS